LVVADDAVRTAKHMEAAIALANELLTAVQGVHQLEYARVSLVKDELGHVRQQVFLERFTLDLSDSPLPKTISALGPPGEGARERYDETPRLSTNAFLVDLAQAERRGVEDAARTLIHE
jgi:hypothetical protein